MPNHPSLIILTGPPGAEKTLDIPEDIRLQIDQGYVVNKTLFFEGFYIPSDLVESKASN